MKIYNLLNMGKPCEDGSRHEKVVRKGSLAALTAAIVAACSPANGEQTKNPPQEVQYASVHTETVTRAECLALRTQTDLMKACMVKLSAQRKAEIAAIDARNKSHDETIAGQGQEAEQLDTTIKVLTEVRDEAFKKDPSH